MLIVVRASEEVSTGSQATGEVEICTIRLEERAMVFIITEDSSWREPDRDQPCVSCLYQ